VSCGPEVELIACRAAGEAAVDVPLEIHGEPRRQDGWAVPQRTLAAELGTASTQGTEAQQFQDPAHGDPRAEGRVVDRRQLGMRHG
jgi:hypothetical protein